MVLLTKLHSAPNFFLFGSTSAPGKIALTFGWKLVLSYLKASPILFDIWFISISQTQMHWSPSPHLNTIKQENILPAYRTVFCTELQLFPQLQKTGIPAGDRLVIQLDWISLKMLNDCCFFSQIRNLIKLNHRLTF